MRTKHIVLSTLFVAILFAVPRLGLAQFTNGHSYLGPHIGLSAYGSAIDIGVNFEGPVTDAGKVGSGIIGVAGRLDYAHFDFGITVITISGIANYHFALDDRKFDPFVGLGLAYTNISGDYAFSYGSGIYLVGNEGMRYFISPGFALRLMLGLNTAFLTVGVDWTL
jgi:hypothetical protein